MEIYLVQPVYSGLEEAYKTRYINRQPLFLPTGLRICKNVKIVVQFGREQKYAY